MFYKGGWKLEAGSTSIEYKDFLSIILTALAIMLAILGTFLAALAVLGFEAIRTEARKIAKDEACKAATLEARVVAGEVAPKAVNEYLKQVVPTKQPPYDYGRAAGEDNNGDQISGN